MIELVTIKDELIEGQRKAAGRQLHSREVIAIDRHNVLIATSKGGSPLIGTMFHANFTQIAKRIESSNIESATLALRKYFETLFDCDLSGQSIAEMEQTLKLGSRTMGVLDLFTKIKGNEDSP